jgi:outer membrane protein assembly factor BamA
VQGAGVRGQLFTNIGNLFNTMKDAAAVRAACGIGLVIALPVGRIEANCSWAMPSWHHKDVRNPDARVAAGDGLH